MITLFGGWPTRAIRVGWLLEELGLDYELRPVDIRARGADTAFMAVNPAGFLPALQDGEVTMVESVAIMEYLLARYGPKDLGPAPSDAAFPAYLQFLYLGEASLAAYLNICVASRFFAPEPDRDNFGARTAQQMFFGRLALVERRLAEAPYMAGERFTAADISVVYALELAGRLGLAEKFAPAVSAYLTRATDRDGYRRASEKQPPFAMAR
jgi:glutathione S-transferase/3-isopropylmalate dehydratase